MCERVLRLVVVFPALLTHGKSVKTYEVTVVFYALFYERRSPIYFASQSTFEVQFYPQGATVFVGNFYARIVLTHLEYYPRAHSNSNKSPFYLLLATFRGFYSGRLGEAAGEHLPQ